MVPIKAKSLLGVVALFFASVHTVRSGDDDLQA